MRLLSDYSKEFNKWFAVWLGGKPQLIEAKLDKPTDYAAIFEISNREQEFDEDLLGTQGVLPKT